MNDTPLPSVFEPNPPPGQQVSAGELPKAATDPKNGRKKRGPRRTAKSAKAAKAPKASKPPKAPKKAKRGRPRKPRTIERQVAKMAGTSVNNLYQAMQLMAIIIETGILPEDQKLLQKAAVLLNEAPLESRGRVVTALGKMFA